MDQYPRGTKRCDGCYLNFIAPDLKLQIESIPHPENQPKALLGCNTPHNLQHRFVLRQKNQVASRFLPSNKGIEKNVHA